MAAGLTTASTAHADPQARTAALVAQHGASLLRVARRVSLCADDAHDAFQRALEIYLRRLDTVDPRTEAAWMRVVVRNEALAVRKARTQLVGSDELDLDLHVDDGQRSAQDRIESAERISRSAEALRGLKPDEARALLLKAEGLSYAEIGDQLGWTYTKVNRCITEGRARFRKLFGGIESGEQCERFGPLLLALAEGTAGAGDLVALKPHLRHCVSCRAEVRRLHGSRWPLAAFLPFPALLERLRPAQLKADLYAFFGRIGSSEPVAQSLVAGGGGRSSTATALVGICLAGAGAGSYCALGGALPGQADTKAAKAVERRASAPERPAASSSTVATTATTPQPASVPAVAHTPDPAPAKPRVRARRTEAARSPARGTGEFSFEQGDAPEPLPTPQPARTSPVSEAVTTSSRSPAPRPAPATSTSSDGEFGFER